MAVEGVEAVPLLTVVLLAFGLEVVETSPLPLPCLSGEQEALLDGDCRYKYVYTIYMCINNDVCRGIYTIHYCMQRYIQYTRDWCLVMKFNSLTIKPSEREIMIIYSLLIKDVYFSE